MKKLEELYAQSVLWESGFDLFDSYSKWLDAEFLKKPEDFLLLELEELSGNKYETFSYFHRYFMDKTDFDEELFSRTLFAGLEKFYHDKNCDFDSYVNSCYTVWNNLPKQIKKDEEPFFSLDYVGVPVEWGDYKQSHEILESAFQFYNGENFTSDETEPAEPKIRAFSEIVSMENAVLTFNNGERILFCDCAGKKWSGKCVCERDITAKPPYFMFFTEPVQTKVIFNAKGFFAKKKNEKNFLKLQQFIFDCRHTSMDLS